MNNTELMLQLQNAGARNPQETLGGMAGGALSGAASSALLPILFSVLQGGGMLPLATILKSAAIGGLGGAGMGALIGGGFNQGLDNGVTSLLTLPNNIIQAQQARKAQTLDDLYAQMR